MRNKIILASALLLLAFNLSTQAQYCTPSAATNCNETITNVTVGTINNTSSGCGTVSQGYSDFTSMNTNLNTGQAYTISVTVNPSVAGDTVNIWVDNNQNLVFNNGAKLLATLGCYTTNANGSTCTGTITIPNSALAGSTRMRVKVNRSGSGSKNSCVDGLYGEAEDYTVNIFPQCSGTPAAATITTAATSICPGSNITLTATDPNSSQGITYQWQQATAQTGPWSNVTGGIGATTLSYTTPALSATTYFRLADSCTNSNRHAFSSAVKITVTQGINITLQPVDSAVVCNGMDTSLTTTATGVGLSYQWMVNTGNGFNNVSNASIHYSGATTHKLHITGATPAMNGHLYIVQINGTCDTITSDTSILRVIVPQTPVTVQGPTILCNGGTVALQTSAQPGYNYQWLSGGGSIAGATTSSYTATATGNYSVAIVTSQNCADTSAAVGVTVYPGPGPVSITAGGPTTFCNGGSVVLSATADSGVLYQWYNGNSVIPGATDTTITATDSGHYLIMVTDSNGCTKASDAQPVNIDVVNPVIQVNGFVLCTGGAYVSYQWFYNGNPIPGATNPCDTATADGDYYVVVNDSFPCGGQSGTYTLNTSGVASHTKNNSVMIYPNPATSYIHIDAPAKVFVVISSLQGKTLLRTDSAKDIDISELASGIYVVQVYDGNMTLLSTQKLVRTNQ